MSYKKYCKQRALNRANKDEAIAAERRKTAEIVKNTKPIKVITKDGIKIVLPNTI